MICQWPSCHETATRRLAMRVPKLARCLCRRHAHEARKHFVWPLDEAIDDERAADSRQLLATMVRPDFGAPPC